MGLDSHSSQFISSSVVVIMATKNTLKNLSFRMGLLTKQMTNVDGFTRLIADTKDRVTELSKEIEGRMAEILDVRALEQDAKIKFISIVRAKGRLRKFLRQYQSAMGRRRHARSVIVRAMRNWICRFFPPLAMEWMVRSPVHILRPSYGVVNPKNLHFTYDVARWDEEFWETLNPFQMDAESMMTVMDTDHVRYAVRTFQAIEIAVQSRSSKTAKHVRVPFTTPLQMFPEASPTYTFESCEDVRDFLKAIPVTEKLSVEQRGIPKERMFEFIFRTTHRARWGLFNQNAMVNTLEFMIGGKFPVSRSVCKESFDHLQMKITASRLLTNMYRLIEWKELFTDPDTWAAFWQKRFVAIITEQSEKSEVFYSCLTKVMVTLISNEKHIPNLRVWLDIFMHVFIQARTLHESPDLIWTGNTFPRILDGSFGPGWQIRTFDEAIARLSDRCVGGRGLYDAIVQSVAASEQWQWNVNTFMAGGAVVYGAYKRCDAEYLPGDIDIFLTTYVESSPIFIRRKKRNFEKEEVRVFSHGEFPPIFRESIVPMLHDLAERLESLPGVIRVEWDWSIPLVVSLQLHTAPEDMRPLIRRVQFVLQPLRKQYNERDQLLKSFDIDACGAVIDPIGQKIGLNERAFFAWITGSAWFGATQIPHYNISSWDPTSGLSCFDAGNEYVSLCTCKKEDPLETEVKEFATCGSKFKLYLGIKDDMNPKMRRICKYVHKGFHFPQLCYCLADKEDHLKNAEHILLHRFTPSSRLSQLLSSLSKTFPSTHPSFECIPSKSTDGMPSDMFGWCKMSSKYFEEVEDI